MNKQSKNDNYRNPSNIRLFFTSKWFWIGLFSVVVGTLIYVSSHRGDVLGNAYKEFRKPSTWTLSEKQIDTGLKCLGSDVTCGAMHFYYDISKDSHSTQTLKSIEQPYLKLGYHPTRTCFKTSSSCNFLGFDINNGKTWISVWLYDDQNPPKAYVDIQENKPAN